MNKLLLVSLFLMNCNGQEYKKLNAKNMNTDNFNIPAFEKDWETIYDGEKIISSSVIDTIKEGIRIRTLFDEGFTEAIEPENSFFGTYKEFYKNGILKKLKTKNLVNFIDGFAPWGKEYLYDKNGKLTDDIDYEKIYQNLKINPENIFQLLDEKKIFEINKPAKYRLLIWFHDRKTKSDEMIWNKLKYTDGENPFWEVVRDYRTHNEEPVNERVFKVDAITGEIKEIH